MKKHTIILHSLLGFFLIIIFAFLFLILTTPGLKLSFKIANKFIPGSLEIENIDGSLIHNVELQNFYYSNNNITLKIKEFKLIWNPLELIGKHLSISQLYIDDIDLNTISQKKEIKKTQKPVSPIDILAIKKLPLHINIGDLSIKNFWIQHDNGPITKIRKIEIQGKISKKIIDLKKFVFDCSPYKINTYATIHLVEPYTIKIDTQILIESLGYQLIRVLGSVEGDLQHQLNFQLNANDPFSAHLTGTIQNALNQGAITVSGKWNDLVIPFISDNNLASKSGELSIMGKLSDYKLSLNSDVFGTNVPQSDINIIGNGNLNKIVLSKIEIKTLQGFVAGNLLLQWHPFLFWKTDLNISKINPGIKWPDAVGEINLLLHSTGKITQTEKTMALLMKNIHGKIHQHDLSGYLEANYNNKELKISSSHLRIGDDFFTIQGELGDIWNFTWRLNGPNITEAFPSATGSVISRGVIQGTYQEPFIKGTVAINNFLWKKVKLDQLNVNSDIYIKQKGISNIDIKGSGLLYQSYSIKNIQANLQGHINNHKLTTQLQTDNGTLNLSLTGQYLNDIWKGTINDLTLSSQKWQRWQLTSPISLLLSSNTIQIAPFCWQSPSGKLCGNLNWTSPNTWKTDITLQDIPLSFFNFLLPEKLNIETQLNGQVNFATDSQERVIGKATFQTTPGKLIYQNNTPDIINFDKNTLTASFAKTGFISNFKLSHDNKTPINVSLNLPDYHGNHFPKRSQKIEGTASINFNNLKLLPIFIPDIAETDGIVQSNIKLSGTIEKPNLEGKADLKNAQVKINPLNIFINKINCNVNLDSNNEINYQGSATIGNGNLSLKGKTTLNDKFPSTIAFKGNNVLVMNNSEYQIFVSPDITIEYKKPSITISGDITIPKANLEPKDFTKVTSLPANAMIINGDEYETMPLLRDMILNINLILGDNVDLSFMGLYAKLGGKLNIKSSANSLTTAIGQIKVNKGEYEAYGEKLYIERGTLTYTGGNIANPAINIRAIKPIQQSSQLSTGRSLIVGIQLTGMISHPKLTLFSEPTGLSDSDILSYLMLGSSASNATGSQAQLLSQAASAIGFGGAANVTSDLKNTFGLTDFGVSTAQDSTTESEDEADKKQTSFVIGKYLTPRIYLNYSIGLLDPINILHIRYKINQRLSLQSETSTRGNGVDVFYSFQSD